MSATTTPPAPVLDATLTRARAGFDLRVALAVGPGEVVAVLGPNGAGKTSLLRALAGLDPGAGGTVLVDGAVLLGPGVDVAAARRPIGMMFQDHLLFPHLDVRDNVAFGLRCQGWGRATARREADGWLTRYGLDGLGDRRPDELSGGQAQRVALARALAPRPRVLLLDEPLAALDATTRHDVRSDLRRRLAEHDGATILVTHDPLDAFALADRAIVVEDGQVTQRGSVPELADRPRSDYVADLLGVNLYRGVASGGSGPSVELSDGSSIVVATEVRGDVFVAIRPNAVAVHTRAPDGAARNAWSGPIASMDLLGGRVRLHVGGPPAVVAEVTPAAVDELGLTVGDRVWVSVKATEVDVYPA